MGTSIIPIGNHKIVFKNKTTKELGEEIKSQLDNLVITNADFILQFYLEWFSNPADSDRIKDIKTFKKWQYRQGINNNLLAFAGPYNLRIEFCPNKIEFFDPPIRYWHWLNPNDKLIRYEWRKYFYQLINHFGGNRVFYLADNAHQLEEIYYIDGTYEELEEALLKKFGPPKKTFEEVDKDYDNAYLIDYFEDIIGL